MMSSLGGCSLLLVLRRPGFACFFTNVILHEVTDNIAIAVSICSVWSGKMLSVLRKGVVAPSQSFARRAMSDAFVFKGVATTNIAEASFRISEGSKIALMGSNDKGECVFYFFSLSYWLAIFLLMLPAKNDIMKLLNGEAAPSSGVVSLLADKKVVRFQPTIPKEFHIHSVKSFLEKNMSPADLKNSTAMVARVSQFCYFIVVIQLRKQLLTLCHRLSSACWNIDIFLNVNHGDLLSTVL